MPKTLVWLASYPKSGNTWLRALLTNYLLNPDEPAAINRLPQLWFGDAVASHYARLAGKPAAAIGEEEALALRARLLAALAGNGAQVNLVKTHSINAPVLGHALIPPEHTRFAIYVLRNPLDMVISYADHYGVDLEHATQGIGSEHNRVVAGRGSVTQHLGDWSGHVASWTRRAAFPVIAIRYEDLHADPAARLAPVIERLGLPLDRARLDKAVEFSSFETLRRQEEQGGFVERSANQRRFFRAGRMEQWRETLPPDLVEAIRARHGAAMKRHGYL